MSWSPRLTRTLRDGHIETLSLGHAVVDDYLAFVGARARANTWLATAFDLKVFFSVVPKEPAMVTTADVFAFLRAQRSPRDDAKVVRLEDGEAGLAGHPRVHQEPLPTGACWLNLIETRPTKYSGIVRW